MKRRKITGEDISATAMILPFLILFALFILIPIMSSVVLSFFQYDMISIPRFIGIGNYIKLFSRDSIFPSVFRNTMIISIIVGPLGYALAFLLAWMINELNRYARTALSFLFYAPALAGNVTLIWTILFSGDSKGYLNSFLLSTGLIIEPVQWLKDPKYTMTIVIIVQLWMSMGVSFLANIAGLQNVDTELYEAGAIDGIKNRWYELWYITLPSMSSILLFGAVMQIQSTFSIGVIAQQLCGFPSINYSTDTIVTYLMDVGTSRYELGYASAISVILFAIMMITRFIVVKMISKTGK